MEASGSDKAKMSEKDSTSKVKGQQGGSSGTGRKSSGTTRYRMAAAQVQQDVARSAQELDSKARSDEKAQRKINPVSGKAPETKSAQVDAETEDNVRGLWKSRVLASYKGKSPKDSHTLLAKISHTGKAALQVSEHYKASALQEAMIAKVDQMFDVFQNCAYEFNKFAQGSELELNWIRPFLSKEGTANWHSSDNNLVVVFSGRMSTRRWTMVVKGTLESVQIFILPADKLIGFALSHENFKPYFQMLSVSEGLDVNWRVDDVELTDEMFTIVNRELFNALIQHAKEEVFGDQRFDLRTCGILPPEPEEDPQVEIDRQKYYQDAFFEDIKNTMDGKFESKPIASRIEEMAKFHQAPAQSPETGDFEQPLPAHIRAELDVLHEQPAPNPVPAKPDKSNQINQLHNIMHRNSARNSMSRAPGMPSPNEPDFSSDDWKQVPDIEPEKKRLNPEQQRDIQKMVDFTLGAKVDPANLQPNKAGVLPHVPPQPMLRRSTPSATPPAPPLPRPPQSLAPSPRTDDDFGSAPSYPGPPKPGAGPPDSGGAKPAGNTQSATNQQGANQAMNQQPMNLPAALTILITSLDRELEVVAKAGADAFAARDLARADAALKFSGRLNEYRQMSQELLDYYRRKR